MEEQTPTNDIKPFEIPLKANNSHYEIPKSVSNLVSTCLQSQSGALGKSSSIPSDISRGNFHEFPEKDCVSVSESSSINFQSNLNMTSAVEENKALKKQVQHLKKRLKNANKVIERKLKTLVALTKIRYLYESVCESNP